MGHQVLGIVEKKIIGYFTRLHIVFPAQIKRSKLLVIGFAD